MLELTQVSKTYIRNGETPVTALAEVSLNLKPGELVMVQGPSGCGKSTLLLTCGGMLTPDAGRMTWNGNDIYALGEEDRTAWRQTRVGFVFQQFHLIPYLSVRDNILAAGAGRLDLYERADALIDRFGLRNQARQRPAELSIGERQRTALARALLHFPGLILADEPTGNLDRDNARLVMDTLADCARQGQAVLLVTHNPDAVQGATRILQMKQGRLL